MALNMEGIDLGSFNTDQPTQVKATMSEAIKTNPDQFAKTVKLSKASGMPTDAVQTDPAEVEQHLKLSNIDFGQMSQRNPNTANYLVDFNNAAIAHDDIDVLGGIEDSLNKTGDWFGKTFENFGETTSLRFEKMARGMLLANAETEQVDPMGFAIPATVAQDELYTKVVSDLESKVKTTQGELQAATPQGLSTVQQGVRGGIDSLITSAPGLFATVLTKSPIPAVASAGGFTYADSYGDARAQGLNKQQAATYASVDASIEMLTEALPDKLLGDMLNGKELKQKVAKFILAEGVGEQVATFGQSMNAVIAGLDEELKNAPTFEEAAKIQLQRQAVTAISTVVAGGVQVGTITGAQKLIDHLTKTEQVAEEQGVVEQKQIDLLAQNAESSKLRERDTESFRQFVQQADGDKNTQVFIDGAQASLYLQSLKPEEIAAEPALQLLAKNTAEAAALGTDVAVPVADFATDIVGTKHYEMLRDHMVMSETSVSPFRQEQVKAETEQFVQRVMNDVQENISEYVAAQDIYNTVRDQLVDSGMVNAQNAAVMAQVVPAWTASYAKRQGITVEEAFNRSGLNIQGPQTGELQRLSDAALQQSSKFSEDNRLSNLSMEGASWQRIRESNPELANVKNLDDEITVYRATIGDDIRPDDYVAVNKQIAETELENVKERDGKGKIVEQKIRVRDLLMANDATEFVYYPDSKFDNVQQSSNTLLNQSQVKGNEQSNSQQSSRSNVANKTTEPSDYARAASRTDAEALAEFERAKTGQQVTFTHRSTEEFDSFDDARLGKNTTTPSASLGHFLSAEDVGNADRYGNSLGVFSFILQNPIVIDAQTFADTLGSKSAADVATMRQRFIDAGHDGVLVNGLNWTIVFEGSSLTHVPDNAEAELFAQNNGEARGYYDPANSMIRLTEAADLSTFLHEFAHFMYEMEMNANSDLIQSVNGWFKRNAESVAKEATSAANEVPDFTVAPVTVTTDDVTNFIDNKTTGDVKKDAAIRRATHEQFARGFENYLMEGTAPSIELRNAFRTFARWLTQIYKAIRGDLKVVIDDQMRQVFDRLLATDDQIAAAESRARYEPMFTDAAMAGMTDAEFEAYKKRQEKVKDKETETLRNKIIEQLTRQTKVWWKEEKNDLVREEVAKLNEQQVYVARNRLLHGDIKLDHATVKEMVGETGQDVRGHTFTKIPPQLKGMTAKAQAGIHPDEAAAFLGYNSGSEMLDDLISAPKIGAAADINAERIMVERHGDILNDGTIKQAADEAVQNEERGKLILDELKALSKGTQQPNLDRQTIKTLAENRIGQLSFREIHPGKYRKAEIAAAQESAKLLAKGDREGAANAKARQVLNYYLGMAATNARNETQKIVDRMARYNKKSVREEIQKAEGGYWEQIVNILERFEFRKSATLSQVAQRNQDINTWAAQRIETDGDGLVLSPAVLNESYVTHWKNVPFSDLQGINDSVKNIEHVARYSNKITRMGEEVDFQQLVTRWVASMNEKATDRFTTKRTDIVEGKNYGRWAMAQMTKIPFMASWMDGGERVGISHQILVQPFTDAYNNEINMWQAAGKPVMDAIEGRSKTDIKRHNTKIFIKEIDDNLFGHQILAVALNTGNAGNLKKMLLGEGWADPKNESEITFNNPKLQAVLSKMTASDWQLVQLIWDQMDTLYPQLAEVHRRTTGLTPPKVEATPVVTKFGTFNGGYYPIKYDPNRSQQAQDTEDKLNAQTESMFSNNASIQASVNAGATNERTGYYAPIRLSLDVVSSHFQETIHYITHHDPVREVNKLIRNKSVADTIKAKLGPEEFAQLKPWLNDIAKDGKEAPTKMFWDAILQRLRFGVTLGAMGFKASTGIMQLSGLSNTIGETGLAPVMLAMRSILGSPGTMQRAWEFAKENSKVLEHRAQTMDREIKNAMKDLESKRGILAAAQQASMKHIALIQTYMADLPSWHAGYIKGMKDFDGDEQRAYQYADWVVEQVQGSGATKDLAKIMRGQSETGRMFTMFMTFFSSLWNMERDIVKGAKSGLYSPTNLAAKAMFLFTIPVLFEMLMRGELGGDDDDESKLQKMLTKVAMFPLQSVPFIRDIANGIGGDYGYNISPLASVIEQGTVSIPKLVKAGFTDDEVTKSEVKGSTKFAGALVGIPGVGQAWATGEHLYDVIVDGEELTMHQLLFGPDRK